MRIFNRNLYIQALPGERRGQNWFLKSFADE